MKRMLLVVTATSATLLIAAPAYAQDAGRDCVDFDSQAEAQEYFDSKGGSATNNVDDLDADGDGIPCEGLAAAAGTGAQTTPAPAATPGATPAAPAASPAAEKKLSNTGVWTEVMGLGGVTLVEFGVGLSLLAGWLSKRRRRPVLAYNGPPIVFPRRTRPLPPVYAVLPERAHRSQSPGSSSGAR